MRKPSFSVGDTCLVYERRGETWRSAYVAGNWYKRFGTNYVRNAKASLGHATRRMSQIEPSRVMCVVRIKEIKT